MRKTYLILAAGVCLLATAVLAQPGPHGGMMETPPPGGMMEGGGPGPFETGDSHDKDRKMLEAMRIARMTEELQLTDRQIAEFFPKLKEMEASMRGMGKNQRKLINQLDSLLNAGAKEQELKAKMTQIENSEAEKWQQMRACKAKLDGILTVKQKARMLVFNQKFDEEIRDMVRDIRQKRMKQFKP
jgi:hypothetical protein